MFPNFLQTRLSNVASFVGASLGAYLVAVITLNLFGPVFGLDRWYAPLFFTLIANNVALAVVVVLADGADGSEDDAASSRRSTAVFIFLNATGALVTAVSSLVETLETNQTEANALQLISRSLLFQDTNLTLYVYFSSLIALGSLFLVLRGVSLVSDSSEAAPSDLGAVASALLTISLVVDSVWRPVPFESRQAVEVWNIVLAIGGLIAAFIVALAFGRLIFFGTLALSSIILRGAMHLGKKITSQEFGSAVLLFAGAILRGALVAAGITALLALALLLVLFALDQGNFIARQTVELVATASFAGLTAGMAALPAAATALAAFVATWVALKSGPQVARMTWVTLKTFVRFLIGIFVAAWFVVNAVGGGARRVWSKITSPRNGPVANSNSLRHARKALFHGLLPVLRGWNAAYPRIAKATPALVVISLCVMGLARSSQPGERALTSKSTVELAPTVANAVAPTEVAANNAEVKIGPAQVGNSEVSPPKLQSLMLKVVSTCDPRSRTLSWVNGSDDQLAVPLESCRMPLDVLQAEHGAILLIAVASTSDKQENEALRATRRAAALARWAEDQVPTGVGIFVLDLGMATKPTSFAFLSSTLGPFNGQRPAPVILVEPQPLGAPVLAEDIAGKLMHEFRFESPLEYFSACELSTYEGQSAVGGELHRVAAFRCASP